MLIETLFWIRDKNHMSMMSHIGGGVWWVGLNHTYFSDNKYSGITYMTN